MYSLVHPRTVAAERRRSLVEWWLAYGGALVATLVIGVAAVQRTSVELFPLAVVLLFVAVAVTLRYPLVGIYIAVFFAVAGDAETVPWYPATKGFSSPESILFLSRSLIVNPFEVIVLAAALGWGLSMLGQRRWRVESGPLFVPIAVFGGFVFLGLANGLGRGGNVNAALWEVRPLVYFLVLFVLASNLCTAMWHFKGLFWAALAGVFVDSLFAISHYRKLPVAVKADLPSLGEHSASLHVNMLLILLFSAWLFRGGRAARLIPLVLVGPAVYVYFLAQRRSAIVALALGIVFVSAVLFTKRRMLFWVVIPLVALATTAYVGAFWNSQSSAAFPAQAIKGVLFPNDLSQEDLSSNIYRQIENHDILATIRSKPLTGIGFGQPFLRPIPLPAITSFLLRDYMTHNSFLWMWMKVGPFGFIATLYVLGLAIRSGARSIAESNDSTSLPYLVAAVSFIAMYVVFCYVDIAWDAQSMAIMGVLIAFIGAFPRLNVLDAGRSREA